MEKLKIAIVGSGNISNFHIKGYLRNPNVELYALCDINEKTWKAKGEKYGITRLYTDEAKMLAELPEIDAVSVCTWNSQHKPCTIMALEAGKHVLCEKPMAMNAKEAQEMIDASKKAGKKLTKSANNYGPFIALMLFVGIPLPGTGAWTGTLAASMLDLDKKKSSVAVMIGVVMAGLIMLLISYLGSIGINSIGDLFNSLFH